MPTSARAASVAASACSYTAAEGLRRIASASGRTSSGDDDAYARIGRAASRSAES